MRGDVPVAPLIDVSVPPSEDTTLERRRSSGSSFSYARSDADSEISRPSDIQNAAGADSQDNLLPNRAHPSQSSTEDPPANEDTPPRVEDSTADAQGSSQSIKKRSGLFMGLQRVGDKVRKGFFAYLVFRLFFSGISSTQLRQLPQSSTISDFFGELRDKKKANVPESHSENHIAGSLFLNFIFDFFRS